MPAIRLERDCKVFYFDETGIDIGGADNQKRMLKPLKPKVLKFRDPQQFRERLLEFADVVKMLPAD